MAALRFELSRAAHSHKRWHCAANAEKCYRKGDEVSIYIRDLDGERKMWP